MQFAAKASVVRPCGIRVCVVSESLPFFFFFFFWLCARVFLLPPQYRKSANSGRTIAIKSNLPARASQHEPSSKSFLSILDFSNISRSRQRKTIEAREIPRIGFDQQTFYPLVVVVLRFWEGWAVTRGLLQPGTTRCYRTRPFFMTRQGTHTRFAKFQYETERRNPSPPAQSTLSNGCTAFTYQAKVLEYAGGGCLSGCDDTIK